MKNFVLQLFTWWNSQTLGTRFFTWRKGEKVGEDQFGNVYYQEKGGKRRWVIYKDLTEASLIPAGWHGWMHHRTDEVPAAGNPAHYEWEKPFQPNYTGTDMAYRPKGSLLADGQRPQVTGDYEAWSPTD
ncbi:NADH:ubiquinone oxidoreductase subunit NDUFA12 [Polycladidibacter hongkongensis]|uniref:NADH:ubiquinone oxidoreductase subunit NDUFA12 n=1 Tax=Polycladidibacter hongkongensis TaxID=1647556 RepID=UPI00082CEE87|nr:NADH:ubiquinone oxidoreductase subunit NDUFA12 [Pseudovibrio hongkongensis]